MPTYKVWLKNMVPGDPDQWGEGTMYAIGLALNEYFGQVVSRTGNFDRADYSWEPQQSVPDHELLVYVLSSASRSIVARFTNQPLGHTGSTFPTPQGVISEVYLDVMRGDRDLPRLVANLIFHELMHNKLDAYITGAPLKDVHTQGGGGMAVINPPISISTRPTPRNYDLMARHLDRAHAQFAGHLSRTSPYP